MIIVSLTSYKDRLPYLYKTLESILTQSMKVDKICITLFKDDLKYINDKLKGIIDKNNMEIIECDEDLKGHKKYFYVMQKYRDDIIITIDDDIVFTDDMVETLYESYKRFPNCVSCRRVHKMNYENNSITKKYKEWNQEYKSILYPSYDLFGTNGAGTLFPPNILNITDNDLENIRKCITADDIFIKYKENCNNVPVVFVDNRSVMGVSVIKEGDSQKNALSEVNTKGQNLNDIYIPMFIPRKKRFHKSPKILVMSMSCNQDIYRHEENVLKETWVGDILNGKYDNVTWMSYTASEDGEYRYSEDEHKLYVPSGDDWHSTYEKTIKAFEWVNENIEYDYIVRTNTSTYVNMDFIMRIIEGLNDYKVYGSRLSKHIDKYFTGFFTIFSKYIVSKLIDNYKPSTEYADDVLIGSCLTKILYRFDDRLAVLKYYKHEKDTVVPNFDNGVLSSNICYRLKGKDRSFIEKNMRKLYNMISEGNVTYTAILSDNGTKTMTIGERSLLIQSRLKERRERTNKSRELHKKIEKRIKLRSLNM